MSDDESTPWLPPNEWRIVHLARFINILDDEKNVLSPVKINVWSANIAAVSTMIAAIFSWFAGHITGIETMMGASIGWLTQAHATHHFDKKERNSTIVKKEEIMAKLGARNEHNNIPK